MDLWRKKTKGVFIGSFAGRWPGMCLRFLAGAWELRLNGNFNLNCRWLVFFKNT